ncbi:sensor histidine kinase [Pseudodesulfovibrio sp. zrk46]|uniref:sensor histidine kinase n=1 Tax=Pseudodesulfovibrio sp. zrk46 TaxID=2725288 RepID=UPI001449D09A|nr:sensor histidine kinase [Pseudodesulfovibrio sp. zrk46]QJB56055.1 sensor histidine kinase [Pseudodesulfovibrio sp. zrk46]
MDSTMDNHESLRFFGKVSASVSHEIKNVFAVINEAAGLLGDLTLMAERGMELDPERLKRVASSIQGQVQRGDTIVKNMNRLAHSTDEADLEVELPQMVELAVALCTRMADMRQMHLSIGECVPTRVVVSPFALIQLLHTATAQALDKMSPQATLVYSVTEDAIVLSVPGQGIELTADAAIDALAASMGVTVVPNTQDGTLELGFNRAA